MDATESIEVLLDSSNEPIESLEALLERCLPSLTAQIWQTCCWPGSTRLASIGDYRFSIVQFQTSHSTSNFGLSPASLR